MRSQERALYEWCPYKKRRLGHRHIQRENYRKTLERDNYLQAKERGSKRNPPCQHLDLEPLSLQNSKKLPLGKPLSLWYHVMVAYQTNT